MSKTPRVIHIISGDRWAGAEVQVYTLVKELDKHTTVAAIVLNEGELSSRLKELGIQTWVVDESRHSSWYIFTKIRQILRQFKPDVVHTHRQKENILGSIANFLTAKARCVRTVHGAPEHKPEGPRKLQVWLDTFCGKFLQDAIISVSNELRPLLAKSYGKHKVFTVLNGIDPVYLTEGLHTPEFKRKKPEATHIGIIGRLDPVKRVDIFLGMAKILLKESPQSNWNFHIFGEGKLLNDLRSTATQLGIEEEVVFHGHRLDMKDCINSLDMVVMPSDHEGLPMTALEALALNKRIVCHKVGGLTSLLSENKDYLVSDHSPRGYAQAIIRVHDRQMAPPKLPRVYHIQNTGVDTLNIYMHTQSAK